MPTTTFNVQMSCDGCSGACTRILNKMNGVKEVNASLEKQTIVVQHESSVSAEEMLEALQNWGKNAGKTVGLAQ